MWFCFAAGDFTGSPDAREKTPSPVPSPVESSKPKLNKYGKPMKSVRWLPDERLEAIRYFENEEGERGDIVLPLFHITALGSRKSCTCISFRIVIITSCLCNVHSTGKFIAFSSSLKLVPVIVYQYKSDGFLSAMYEVPTGFVAAKLF